MKDKWLFGTKEWAPRNFNFMNGCSNDCVYCYAKEMAIRFKRKTRDNWKQEDSVSMRWHSYTKKDGRIMIPSSHDITPGNIDVAVSVMHTLLDQGNELLIVTKPHLSCTRRMLDELAQYRSQIQFRFTIGSADDNTLRRWEPNAPNFSERLESLKLAFQNNFSTSISCEPLLDDKFGELYEQIIPYVSDCIWVGKMNLAERRVKVNTGDEKLITMAKELAALQCDENIVTLWNHYKDNPTIQWKESIKKVIGLD